MRDAEKSMSSMFQRQKIFNWCTSFPLELQSKLLLQNLCIDNVLKSDVFNEFYELVALFRMDTEKSTPDE